MAMTTPRFIRWFRDVGIADVRLVGGKNASLGEMYRELTPEGIRVPNGFAVTTDAYRHFLNMGKLNERIRIILQGLDTRDLPDLAEKGRRVRDSEIVGHLFDESNPAVMRLIEDVIRRSWKWSVPRRRGPHRSGL
jgi:pyruvate,water dikinase